MDYQNYYYLLSNFDGGNFLKIRSFINLPWGHVMSHKKFGPDRFSRFDVYWIQTNKQTDKPNLYIDKICRGNFLILVDLNGLTTNRRKQMN